MLCQRLTESVRSRRLSLSACGSHSDLIAVSATIDTMLRLVLLCLASVGVSAARLRPASGTLGLPPPETCLTSQFGAHPSDNW